jgi:hypothetical protein
MSVFKDEGRDVRDFGHSRRPMLRLAVSRF